MKDINLTVSNLAWKNEKLHKVIFMFKKNNIKYLEFSPNVLLKNDFSKDNIQKIKNFWKKKNFQLYSMQSLLFNINDAYLFGDKIQKKIFLKEVIKKISLAKNLGTKIIVFGSPKNKKNIYKKKLSALNLESISIFRKIDQVCRKKKIIFCLESNPKIYNCDYLNETKEAIDIARKINSKYFKVNLDLGTVISNKENITKLIKNYLKYFAHCQFSMPLLKKINMKNNIFAKTIKLLKKEKYKGVISIEMLPVKNNLKAIEKILKNYNQLLNNL